MHELAAIIAGVLRATAPTKTASGKPSLVNYLKAIDYWICPPAAFTTAALWCILYVWSVH